MFTAILEDGTHVNGDKCPWHEMPATARVVSLAAQVSAIGVDGGEIIVVADDVYAGFDAYGFQMYNLEAADGSGVLGRGVQLLCVAGDDFLTVDINLNSGQRRARWQPLSRMTYNRSLLRPGTGC